MKEKKRMGPMANCSYEVRMREKPVEAERPKEELRRSRGSGGVGVATVQENRNVERSF